MIIEDQLKLLQWSMYAGGLDQVVTGVGEVGNERNQSN